LSYTLTYLLTDLLTDGFPDVDREVGEELGEVRWRLLESDRSKQEADDKTQRLIVTLNETSQQLTTLQQRHTQARHFTSSSHTVDSIHIKVTVKVRVAIGNPSQSYGASPAIWNHTVLLGTRHR